MSKVEKAFLEEIQSIFKIIGESIPIDNLDEFSNEQLESLAYNCDLLAGMFEISNFSNLSNKFKIIIKYFNNSKANKDVIEKLPGLLSEINFEIWQKIESENYDINEDEFIKYFDSIKIESEEPEPEHVKEKNEEQIIEAEEASNSLVSEIPTFGTQPDEPAPAAGVYLSDKVELDAEILPIFIEGVTESVQVIEKELLNLENDPNNIDILNEVFRSMHSLKGNSGLVGIDSINFLAHRSENILDKVRKNQLTLNSDIIDVLLECNDIFKQALEMLKVNPVNPEIDVAHLVKILDAIVAGKEIPTVKPLQEIKTEQPPQDKKSEQPASDLPQTPAAKPVGPAKKITQTANIRVDISKLDNVMNLIGEIVIDKIRLNQKIKKLTTLSSLINDTILILEGDSENDLNDNCKILIDDKISDFKINFLIEYNEYKTYKNEIESLTNIIADLQKGQIDLSETSNSYDIQEIKDELKRINRFFKDSTQELNFLVEHLSLIASELQEGIMQMRMVSISQLFDKIPRMVRTLTKDLNKKVNLEIIGEETELDKTVIEQLSEPLLHIIRNSLDHGVETPEARKQKNKPETGKLIVKAEHKGNQIEVVIEDDGKGIDEKIILKKAIEKGIVSKERAAIMQSNEIVELIFKPGFSSADKISDVSGRGVGMDVVLTNIKKLKGTVEVETELNAGTKLSIRLPLTMAIMQVQLIKCANQVFAVPINFIEEIIKIDYSEIRHIGPKSTFDLRGEIVSIVDLSDILDIPVNTDITKESCNIIIIRMAEKSIGFIVDKILGQQEIVIKKLGSILKNIEHVSGATILGEGNVILILDILGIYATAKKTTQAVRKKRNLNLDLSTEENLQKKAENKTILVVDDAKTIRKSLINILEKSGFEVAEASDGVEALSVAMSKKVDLFTVDVMMPRMNGYDFVKNIRNTPEYVKTPVIMISSKSEQIDKMRGIDSGADDYLIKPFDKNALLKTINKLLQ